MMATNTLDRLPAIPIITNDPYFSVWCPADTLTQAQTVHWSGYKKPLVGTLTIDEKAYRFMGTGSEAEMETTLLRVSPMTTLVKLMAGGVELAVHFTSPLLPDDLDILSTPVTIVKFSLRAMDGKEHSVSLSFEASDKLCYHDSGTEKPAMFADTYEKQNCQFAYTGKYQQHVLGHSGDLITIDWGYLYMVAQAGVSPCENGLRYDWSGTIQPSAEESAYLLLGYDDIASILYYGTPCKAWYARNGKSLPDAMAHLYTNKDEVLSACDSWDKKILNEAIHIGGDDYALIVSASWRQTIAAHKLIATPQGEMAFLSKENDSNGCAGTVDISYPSTPLFLKYCPELVNAMCRPVLQYASMPIWTEPFAPHDVGRYPIINGEAYAAVIPGYGRREGNVFPPYYLYPAGKAVYNPRRQMPVEECGNMLIMLCAAFIYTGDLSLLKEYKTLIDKWAQYLSCHGEDPGEQLCTDDFAGHLAHNANLAAKAIMGLACYNHICKAMGVPSGQIEQQVHQMAGSWLRRASDNNGSKLSFQEGGWSQKYNLVWDLVLGFDIFPKDFFARETKSYIGKINEYGLPLDSRETYSKSDWILWSATMSQDKETFCAMIKPVAKYLRETTTRVPFSDWYDTVTGKYVRFIARSVQGGVFMPMLRKNR